MRGQTSERNSFYEKPSLLGSSFQFNMVNFSSANSTNATNTIRRESDTADVPSVAAAINVIIINTITFLFTVLLNLLVIKSCKVDASTPYQQRHFAGLFSGDWRLNWSLWPTIVCPVEYFPNIRSQWQRNSWKLLCHSCNCDCNSFILSSDVGYSRETPCDQIYDAIPKHKWWKNEESSLSSLDPCFYHWGF